MTHSYGNGRRLDDSKSLGELSFQVKYNTQNCILIHGMYIKFNMDELTCFDFEYVDWRLLRCGNLVEEKDGDA